MNTAIYAGSFDPFTNGHLDILENGTKIFDKVIILVANNLQKKYLLPVETRLDLIKKSVNHIGNVSVDYFDGLIIEYAKKHSVSFLIRGLRTSTDFEYEMQMAQVNTGLEKSVKTIFIPAIKENCCISSTMIRELLSYKSDISKFVPKAVNEYLLSNPVVGQ